ncbi:MAG: hypothetical protein IIZ93_16035 [Acidaminococcaceae bacterium]|nr:hypothetical protein [Acidaminococcaceae bacterium]
MTDCKGRKIEAMYSMFGVFAGKTCEDCPHLVRHCYHGKNYYKCRVYGDSSSEATDWRLKWTACGGFDKVAEGNATPIYKRLQYVRIATPENPAIPVCEGQITMEELFA